MPRKAKAADEVGKPVVAEAPAEQTPRKRKTKSIALSEEDDKAPADRKNYKEDGFVVNVPLEAALKDKGKVVKTIQQKNVVSGQRTKTDPQTDEKFLDQKCKDDFSSDDYAALSGNEEEEVDEGDEDYDPGEGDEGDEGDELLFEEEDEGDEEETEKLLLAEEDDDEVDPEEEEG